MEKKYTIAMKLWNDVMLAYPDNKEAKMGILLCDVASDNEEQSIKMFEYYQILKAQNLPNAEENIINLIDILIKIAIILYHL